MEVIAKLLDNACKFSDAKQGQVAIAITAEDPHKLTVSIIDNGRGIEPKRLETVFDRFYQEEGALRRSAGGTGLGLAICRQIVTAWGERSGQNPKAKIRGVNFPLRCRSLKNPAHRKRTRPAKQKRKRSVPGVANKRSQN